MTDATSSRRTAPSRVPLVGYDRFEGEQAYRQLAELYRAVRLYVSGFQLSMKLHTKQREGSKASRTYHDARTQVQRLIASPALPENSEGCLVALFQALDSLCLLHQLLALQGALWQHAILPSATVPEAGTIAAAYLNEVRFDVLDRGLPTSICRHANDANDATSSRTELTALPAGQGLSKRKYRRSTTHTTRTWRKRADPFASIWDEVRQCLEIARERTAKVIYLELQQEYPGRYPDDATASQGVAHPRNAAGRPALA